MKWTFFPFTNAAQIRHIKNIHACCILLLSTRYLNDSPVEVLHQTFKGGLLSEGKLLPGLFWVSHLFQNSLSGASFKIDSAPNILVWIMLEMMRVQKNFNFVLCVKARRFPSTFTYSVAYYYSACFFFSILGD